MDTVDMMIDYPHLGNEFLTWMWWSCDTKEGFEFAVGNKIVFAKEKDTVTIKGDESEVVIGKVAMLDGYVVNEMQLIFSKDDPRFLFTVKGCDLSMNGLKLPKSGQDSEDDEEDGIILERVMLIEEVSSVIDKIFKEYILERLSRVEWSVTVQKIKDWINEG